MTHVLPVEQVGAVELAPGMSLGCVVMRFGRNAEIFAEEDRADFVCKVLSGGVRCVRLLGDGRRHIDAFHVAGEVFGLDWDERRRRYSAEAVVNSEIAVVRRRDVDRLVEADSAAARQLWGLTSGELQRLRDHLRVLHGKSALGRVAHFLTRMASSGGAGQVVDLPMTRSDIADFLSLTIETVSRSLHRLERAHAISIPSSHQIVLHAEFARAIHAVAGPDCGGHPGIADA